MATEQLRTTNGVQPMQVERPVLPPFVFPDQKTTCQASGRTKRFFEALINAKKQARIFSRLQLCFDVYQGIPFSEASQNFDYFVDSVRDEFRDKIGPWRIVTIPDKQDTRRLKNNRQKTYTLKNKDEENFSFVLPNGHEISDIGNTPRNVLEMIMEGDPEGKPVNSDELLELFPKSLGYSARFNRLTTTIRNLKRRLAKFEYTIKIIPAAEEKIEELRGLYFYTLEEQKMPALPATKPADSKQIEPGIKKENRTSIIAGMERKITLMILSWIQKGELKKVVATPQTLLQIAIPKGIIFESLYTFGSEAELNQYFVDAIMKTVDELWSVDNPDSLSIRDAEIHKSLVALKSVEYTKKTIEKLIRTWFKIRPPTPDEAQAN